MQINTSVVVVVSNEQHNGKITRLPGKLPRGYSTGTGKFPYYGVTIQSYTGEPVELFFLLAEIDECNLKGVTVSKRTMTLEEYLAEAEERFGKDRMKWRFVCPGCGHIASTQDYKNAGAPDGAVGFSCIGRYLATCRDWLTGDGDGPCNYTQGGLFGIAPVEIIANGQKHHMFELAPKSPGQVERKDDKKKDCDH